MFDQTHQAVAAYTQQGDVAPHLKVDVAAAQLQAMRHDAIEPAQRNRILDDFGDGFPLMLQRFLSLRSILSLHMLLQQGLQHIRRTGVGAGEHHVHALALLNQVEPVVTAKFLL